MCLLDTIRVEDGSDTTLLSSEALNILQVSPGGGKSVYTATELGSKRCQFLNLLTHIVWLILGMLAISLSELIAYPGICSIPLLFGGGLGP